MQYVCWGHTRTEDSLHNLSFVRRETKSGDPKQHRNAKVPEGDSSVLALIDFLTWLEREKGLRVLELPAPPLLQPLPTHSPAKQEIRPGSLPGPRLGQEPQETSEKDRLQHRRRLLRNPWEGKINPAPAEFSPRGGKYLTCLHSLAWSSMGLTIQRADPELHGREQTPSKDPPLRETKVCSEAGGECLVCRYPKAILG